IRLYVGPTAVQPPTSVTLTVIGKMPLAVGVPERTPVAGLSVRPGGSVPELIVKLTGGVPPFCVKVWLNGTPTVPWLTTGFTTDTPGQVTVRVNGCDDPCGLFFSAWNTRLYVPEVLGPGVPESVPVPLPRSWNVMPAGRAPST